jgi:RHS repeat-associated protein
VQTTYGFGAAGLVQRFVPATGVTYGYTFDPSGNVVQRSSSIHLAESIYADFTTFYDAFGGQLHQIDVTTSTSFQSPDAVGFGGQWGYYTENVTFLAAAPGQMPIIRYPLCLLGARFYDPLVGRFVTRDPVGYDGGINLYGFCGNNPVMRADPSGLDWLDFGTNLAAGWGDGLTGGLTGWVRGKLGVDGVVDKGSGAYIGGYVVGMVHQTVLFNAAGKAISAARATRAAQAGTGAFRAGAAGGSGLGLFANRTVNITAKGLSIIEKHLGNAFFEQSAGNVVMLRRLRAALVAGKALEGADAVFYTHEINEATTMARLGGYTEEAYAVAHKATLAKYGVSPFSVYHPEAIAADEFLNTNANWMKFWNSLK